MFNQSKYIKTIFQKVSTCIATFFCCPKCFEKYKNMNLLSEHRDNNQRGTDVNVVIKGLNGKARKSCNKFSKRKFNSYPFPIFLISSSLLMLSGSLQNTALLFLREDDEKCRRFSNRHLGTCEGAAWV